MKHFRLVSWSDVCISICVYDINLLFLLYKDLQLDISLYGMKLSLVLLLSVMNMNSYEWVGFKHVFSSYDYYK